MPSASPVFIVGAPRSGTTLPHHMLLSSGGFANYRAEAHAYSLVGPRFSWLRSAKQRQAYWDLAHKGYLFTRGRIPEERAKSIVLEESHDVGSYLDGFMSEICQRIVSGHPAGRVEDDKALAPIGQEDPVPRSTGRR